MRTVPHIKTPIPYRRYDFEFERAPLILGWQKINDDRTLSRTWFMRAIYRYKPGIFREVCKLKGYENAMPGHRAMFYLRNEETYRMETLADIPLSEIKLPVLTSGEWLGPYLASYIPPEAEGFPPRIAYH